MRLRALTYNLHGLRDDRGAVVEVIRALEPDLVLIQESGSKRALDRLAGEVGMASVSTHQPFGRVRNAILYPNDWRLVEAHAREFHRMGQTIRRGLVAAHLRGQGVRLTAISVHLGLSGRERVRHARELTDYLGGLRGHVVMGIDLNEGPESAASRWIAGRLIDAYGAVGRQAGTTFPASAPSARIDYVFLGEGLRPVGAAVPGSPMVRGASDHLPVVADVEVPDR